MQRTSGSRSGLLQWVIVLVVGVLVVTLVLGLQLIPRLGDGQKVLDAARPAFAADRVAGARAGIDAISTNVDMADPVVTENGGAAAEVPKLIAFVSQQTGLTQEQVVAALQKNFPHTTALLQAIPLSSVTAELPELLAFLQTTLKLSEEELLAALTENFPALAQAITNLPTVTNGWEQIEGIDGLTRFDGTPVQSVPDLRTYFSADVIPVLERQQGNFASLDEGTVDWIPTLILAIGVVVILFALLMIALNLRGGVSRGVAMGGAGVVVAVGVGVTAIALAISLAPRVSDGQELLDDLKPVAAAERVKGDRAGIEMVSAIADTLDPVMTEAGGASTEVPKLVAFVSEQTGLSQAQVLAALQENFPHTTALLQAIPLSAVTEEIPELLGFLQTTLKLSEAELLAALTENFPGIAQAVTNLPAVTNGWEQVPNAEGMTRFDGSPVESIPDVRTYFSADLIPVLETQQGNYANLISTSQIDFIGPLVLIVGLIVIVYGLLMLYLASRIERTPRAAPAAGAAAPSPA